MDEIYTLEFLDVKRVFRPTSYGWTEMIMVQVLNKNTNQREWWLLQSNPATVAFTPHFSEAITQLGVVRDVAAAAGLAIQAAEKDVGRAHARAGALRDILTSIKAETRDDIHGLGGFD